MALERYLGVFRRLDHKAQERARMVAQTKREAAECDCWRAAGPLCARCKRKQAKRLRAMSRPPTED